ncbi:hypothetical protein D3C84_1083010 [compost metagenome]
MRLRLLFRPSRDEYSNGKPRVLRNAAVPMLAPAHAPMRASSVARPRRSPQPATMAMIAPNPSVVSVPVAPLGITEL